VDEGAGGRPDWSGDSHGGEKPLFFFLSHRPSSGVGSGAGSCRRRTRRAGFPIAKGRCGLANPPGRSAGDHWAAKAYE